MPETIERRIREVIAGPIDVLYLWYLYKGVRETCSQSARGLNQNAVLCNLREKYAWKRSQVYIVKSKLAQYSPRNERRGHLLV